MLQNATSQEISARLTCLPHVSPVLHLPREIHLCRSSSNVPRLLMFWKLLQTPHVFLTFWKVQNLLRLPHTTTSERPKVAQGLSVFDTFDFQMCFARRRMVCFVHFDFDMCFAPQRRALFQRLNFQVLRTRQFFTLWTSKFASRHNRTCGALYMLTSTTTCKCSYLLPLASLLFELPEPQVIRKTQ